jgi:hypothetical protein
VDCGLYVHWSEPMTEQLWQDIADYLRLQQRIDEIDAALREGRLLLEEGQRHADQHRLDEIEAMITYLGHEKAEAARALRDLGEGAPA